jgi:trimethylamine--corrinoid protein Co-methyltransferase
MTRPGTPLIYSSLSTVGDMRSGAYAPGGVECGMLNMAHAQMAKFYNVPCSGYIGLTNSKLNDAQAGYEKALSCMGGLLAGMHVLQFARLSSENSMPRATRLSICAISLSTTAMP